MPASAKASEQTLPRGEGGILDRRTHQSSTSILEKTRDRSQVSSIRSPRGVIASRDLLAHTADQQLELAFVKDVDELLRDELVEAAQERVELVLDAAADPPLDDQLHVLLLVLVRDGNVAAAGLQVDRDDLAEPVVLGREGVVENVGDVVLAVPSFGKESDQLFADSDGERGRLTASS